MKNNIYNLKKSDDEGQAFETIVSNKSIISIYTYIYMLLEIFPVSPLGFESFTRRFGSPFGAIFKRGGWVVYVVLASLSRVRFGECLLSEFLESENLVGWEVQEVWG